MATYVNDLRLKEIGTGESSGTWGTETNTNLELIAEAFSFGTEAITTNADTHTTTIADGSTDPGRSIYLKYTGTLDSACTITIGPNTVSKLWFIENGTSGSQNIIISQGSGANVTIPAGHVKAIYSDGAGSGAAMVDAFTNLNLGGTTTVDDLTISDDLTVTDDMTVGGTLGVTGIVTLTDDLIIGDGKTIGSASDVDAMTIASNGQVTFSQTLIGTALDISGDIDVDGTTNLDVVDIDGAVDMASTLAVGGVVTANAGVVVDNITIDGTEIDLSSGDLTIDVAGDIILDADGGDVIFKDAGSSIGRLRNVSGNFVIKSEGSDDDLKFAGNDGGSEVTALTLDMSNAGRATFNENVTVGGNLAVDGADFTITANVKHAGDTDTFFGFNEADTFRIVTGGTEALRVNSSQNVGIGTSSPSADLETVGSTGIKTGNGSGTGLFKADGGSTKVGSLSNHRFDLVTNNTVRASIDTSGNLGIGTTSPQKALDIAGASSGGGAVMRLSGTGNASEGDVTGAIQFHNADDTDNTAGVFGIIRGVAGPSGGEGSLQILTDMPSEGADASTVAMHISSTAKIGINTENPDQTLHVHKASAGSVSALSDSVAVLENSTHAYLSILAPNDKETGVIFGDADSNSVAKVLYNHNTDNLSISADDDIVFVNDGDETFRSTVDHHVLIGTTTNQGVGGISFQHNASVGVNIQQNMDGTSGGAELYVFRRNSTQIGSINQSSTNAVTYNTSSDARLKDVTGSSRGLDVINNLNPVAYNWKADNHADEGLIAQEVEELVPNAVNQDEDGYYSMDYSKLVTHLVKGMQEQQEQIESLKSEIANLRGE